MPIIIKCQFVRQVLIPFKNKTTTLPYLLSQVSSLNRRTSQERECGDFLERETKNGNLSLNDTRISQSEYNSQVSLSLYLVFYVCINSNLK
jgi:hypothetical protein